MVSFNKNVFLRPQRYEKFSIYRKTLCFFVCFLEEIDKKGQVNLLIIGLFDATESVLEALGGKQDVVILPEIRIIKIA